MAIAQGDEDSAVSRLAEAFPLLERLPGTGGLAGAGQVYGTMLLRRGERLEARRVLQISLDAYRALGQHDRAKQVMELLASAASTDDQEGDAT